jgi:hypothetical protein
MLQLRRAPVMLRVVHSVRGGWDALDQEGDDPKPSETVHVYIMVGEPTRMHILIRGKGKKDGGFFASARYRYLDVQPADEIVRAEFRWRGWCEDNKAQLLDLKTRLDQEAAKP